MADAAALYGDLVTERARRPLFGGTITDPDGAAENSNPLCGDRTRVSLRCDSAGRAVEIRHDTRACAICAASADLLAERGAGMDRLAAAALAERFTRLLEQGGEDAGLGPLAVFAELHGFRSRRKCALLPFATLLDAFDGRGGN